MKKQSLYFEVYKDIKKQIDSGALEPGDLLLPEPRLEEKYKVSRTTVRKAIEMLARHGYVSIKQGKGTEVLDNKTKQKLTGATSFTETMKENGYDVYPVSIHIDFVVPPVNISNDFQIAPDKEVVRIQRVIATDTQRVAMVTNYLLPEFVPGIESKTSQIKSLYQFLENEYNIKIDSATDYIKTIAADFYDAEILKVPVGTPLFNTKRVTYSGNTPFEVVLLKIIGSIYQYVINLPGR